MILVEHCTCKFAVTALVTDAPDPIESGDQSVASAGRQCVRGRHGLLEHADQGIEVAFILIAEVAKPDACSQ